MLGNFTALVEHAREKKLDKFIENSSCEHAKTLFENLLLSSTKEDEIKIVSGSLNENFYTSLLKVFQGAVFKKLDIRILNPLVTSENNNFILKLKTLNSPNVSIKIVDAKSDRSDWFSHFILVGDNRFRVETDHSRIEAVANFNNHSSGNRIKELFHDIESLNDFHPA